MKQMYKKGGNMTAELLNEKYIREEKSMAEIAKELNCSPATVFKYLKKYGIKTRTGCTDKTKKR